MHPQRNLIESATNIALMEYDTHERIRRATSAMQKRVALSTETDAVMDTHMKSMYDSSLDDKERKVHQEKHAEALDTKLKHIGKIETHKSNIYNVVEKLKKERDNLKYDLDGARAHIDLTKKQSGGMGWKPFWSRKGDEGT